MAQEELTREAARFLETLVSLKGGKVLNEIGSHLAALVVAVKQTNSNGLSNKRGGKLIVEFAVAPWDNGRGDCEVITLECRLKETMPQPPLGRALFYADDNGALNENNPRQLRLPDIVVEKTQAQGE